MNGAPGIVVSAAVEGDVDEAVVRGLIQHLGAAPGPIHGKNGKVALRRNVHGYNNAARFSPWIVVIDLDHDADCAPPVRQDWMPGPAQYLAFRIAVREIESWLLADREHISRFLQVRPGQIPDNPDSIDNPKEFTVALARQSRSRAVRQDMVPRQESGRVVGPAYSSRLIEFVTHPNHRWRPDIAMRRSDSLTRCARSLSQVIDLWRRHLAAE